MSDPNSTSPDIFSDGPVKNILRPEGCRLKTPSLVKQAVVAILYNSTLTTVLQLFSIKSQTDQSCTSFGIVGLTPKKKK
jgi:hypothetical protein